MANNEDMCRVMNDNTDWKAKYEEADSLLNARELECEQLRMAIKHIMIAYEMRCER